MAIYVNQLGFYTNDKKHATISGCKGYELINQDGQVVLKNAVDYLTLDESSKEEIAFIDFSNITEKGTYYFKDSEGNQSYHFRIGDDIYRQVSLDALKMFYFQRCGMALEEKYAGPFQHKACHMEPVSVLRKEKEIVDCCGGWHDAGDYGKYTTPGAVALAHLLYAFELNEAAFDTEINIPESGNGVPDLLNECRYELEFLLKMQKENGGVSHKCTALLHTGFVMPEDDEPAFYQMPVSSLATADFAAICAMAGRVYEKYDPAFIKRLHVAALNAWDWLLKHPVLEFENPAESRTGAYDDCCDADERLWAAVEIYRITKNDVCLEVINQIFEMRLSYTALGWKDVGGLAALAALTAKEGTFDRFITERFRNAWLDEADRLIKIAEANSFEVAMHPYDYGWGSNMIVLTNAMVLCFAQRLTGDDKYLQTAMYQLDYIFGRNALAISYVTGHGENAFKNPHNRPTIMDEIDEPIPGFVSGGPNKAPCDPDALAQIPRNTAPMKCHVDDWRSYSTNEITIYWNSPLVFILSFVNRPTRF